MPHPPSFDAPIDTTMEDRHALWCSADDALA